MVAIALPAREARTKEKVREKTAAPGGPQRSPLFPKSFSPGAGSFRCGRILERGGIRHPIPLRPAPSQNFFPPRWSKKVTLQDGSPVHLRPIRPIEDDAMPRLLARFSTSTMDRRFPGIVRRFY